MSAQQDVSAKTLSQTIYVSRPFGYDESTLLGILINARYNNEKNDVTGALICRSDVYLQLLEGPADNVDSTYDSITRDDRHVEVTRLSNAPVATRLFGNWAMLHDPARSWLWTQDEVADGAITHAAPDEVLSVFERLAAEARKAGAAS